jgi:hypothetical protein
MNIKYLALACLFVTFQNMQSNLFDCISDCCLPNYKLEENKREQILAVFNNEVKSHLEEKMPKNDTPQITIFEASLGHVMSIGSRNHPLAGTEDKEENFSAVECLFKRYANPSCVKMGIALDLPRSLQDNGKHEYTRLEQIDHNTLITAVIACAQQKISEASKTKIGAVAVADSIKMNLIVARERGGEITAFLKFSEEKKESQVTAEELETEIY